jgi:hypothetical protein
MKMLGNLNKKGTPKGIAFILGKPLKKPLGKSTFTSGEGGCWKITVSGFASQLHFASLPLSDYIFMVWHVAYGGSCVICALGRILSPPPK